jgi:hypothetical protein
VSGVATPGTSKRHRDESRGNQAGQAGCHNTERDSADRKNDRTRKPYNGGPAQPGVAVDRFAREILAF